MTLVKTNSPFTRSFDGLMNELFNDLPSSLGKTVREEVFSFPPVNILEKSESYDLALSAPGFDKADFAIKLDGNILTVSAEKINEQKAAADKMIRKEFSTKSFKRSFTVDEKIEAGNISAKYENGILNVVLPKKEQAKAITKEINIQ
ncbi:MAG: Hsp20/alpha crystallin family protein [Ferruginibacter sp.]